MKNNSRGAVSIFIVLFFVIVMTIGVVSFTRIMLVNQRQATDSDLSQSAYDSALAGVEDAKRLLLWHQQNPNVPGALAAIENRNCNTNQVLGDIVKANGSAVAVSQTGSTSLYQQYTCVKINQNTPDYLGSTNGEVKVVPLEGTEGFNQIRISWFTNKDSASISLPPATDQMRLPKNANWPADRPGAMRAQISYSKDGSFKSSDFVSNGASNKTAGSLTGFFYPKSSVVKGTKIISNDNNIATENSSVSLQSADCNTNDFQSGGYACSVMIDAETSAGVDTINKAYLNLTPLYRTSNQSFKVELLKVEGGVTTVIPFKNVQPEVDSTGRSNDVYRRILARVSLEGNTTYLTSGVNALTGSTPTSGGTGNFCKDFYVGDSENDTNFDNTTGCVKP